MGRILEGRCTHTEKRGAKNKAGKKGRVGNIFMWRKTISRKSVMERSKGPRNYEVTKRIHFKRAAAKGPRRLSLTGYTGWRHGSVS